MWMELDPKFVALPSGVSSATASSHTALLVMVAHVGSDCSHESNLPEVIILNCIAVMLGTVGIDGAAVFGLQSQRHWSSELHCTIELSAVLKNPFDSGLLNEQPTNLLGLDFNFAIPSLSDVSSATASLHTALLVMVTHEGSTSSQESPPEANILNCTVAVGVAVEGTADGAEVVGVDGADVVGAVVGLQSQRHFMSFEHPL